MTKRTIAKRINPLDLDYFLSRCAKEDNKIALPLFRLLANYGLRPEEVQNLMLADLTEDKLYIAPHGNQKERILSLDEKTSQALHEWANLQETPLLFPISLAEMEDLLQNIARKAGINNISLQDFRYTLQEDLRIMNVPAAKIRDMLG